MIKKIKEYFEYRRNKKIAKRSFVSIVATVLPTIDTIATKGSDIVNVVVRIADEAKSTDKDALIEMVLNTISEILKTNNSRLIEILSYMASLPPEDMQKIIVNATVESNRRINKN